MVIALQNRDCLFYLWLYYRSDSYMKYIIRNNKLLIVNKPRKLTKEMKPEDMATEYKEKIYETKRNRSKDRYTI